MTERITVRMTSEMISRIDAWIARQPGYISRQEAVRHCVDLMLDQPTVGQGIGGASGARAQETTGTGAVD